MIEKKVRDMPGWASTALIVALMESLLGLSGMARGEAKRRLEEFKRRLQACELAQRNPSSGAPGDEPSRELV